MKNCWKWIDKPHTLLSWSRKRGMLREKWLILREMWMSWRCVLKRCRRNWISLIRSSSRPKGLPPKTTSYTSRRSSQSTKTRPTWTCSKWRMRVWKSWRNPSSSSSMNLSRNTANASGIWTMKESPPWSNLRRLRIMGLLYKRRHR